MIFKTDYRPAGLTEKVDPEEAPGSTFFSDEYVQALLRRRRQVPDAADVRIIQMLPSLSHNGCNSGGSGP